MNSPKSLHNDAASRRLRIVWEDMEQWVDNAELRRHCRCADCRLLSQTPEGVSVSPDTEIQEIRLVGAYAVQFFFSDGHNRGIYPWTYLRDLPTGATKA